MDSVLGHSAACCNILPIISKGYVEKGKYETIEGVKTYVTGPATATKALLVIYDIFGFFPQTIQGADILAAFSSQGYQVFMPDFFAGEPADIAWYPPLTGEQQKALYAWIPTRMPATGIEKVPGILEAVEGMYGKKTWGAVGFCWGGKVVSVLSGADSPFKAAAQAHPGMIDATDAAAVTIPICMLASGDEDADEVAAWEAALAVDRHVETFGDQIHGWMSARADLEDEKVQKEYERGYRIFVEFFGKYL